MSCENQLAQITTTVNSRGYNTNGISRLFLFNFQSIESQIIDLTTTVDLSNLNVQLKEYIVNEDSSFTDSVSTDEFGAVYEPTLSLDFDGIDGIKNQFIREVAQPSARLGVIAQDSMGVFWLIGRYNGLAFSSGAYGSNGAGTTLELKGKETEPVRQISGVLNLPNQVIECQPFTQVIVSGGTASSSSFDCASLNTCTEFTTLQSNVSTNTLLINNITSTVSNNTNRINVLESEIDEIELPPSISIFNNTYFQ